MTESKQKKRERLARILQIFQELYPDSKSALNFHDPLQCLISTILSAQCTDHQVNKVTPALFQRYRDVESFASADRDELSELIRSTGFYKNKTKLILNCTQSIIKNFNGQVPDTMEELLTLDGVGRKTANCVLGNAYHQPAITVDTHVKRLSYRLGLTKNTDPDKIELDLRELIPSDAWLLASHMIIDHGRAICKARNPECTRCTVIDLCPRIGINESRGKL